MKTLLLLTALAAMAAAAVPSRATTYATWLMVWYGHDQAWWSPGTTDAARTFAGGKWQTLDWADNDQVAAHLDLVKQAGVEVVIGDLTNGWGWLDSRCQYIQSLCAPRQMKFCVAENSGGNTVQFESHCKDIWDRFAGPDAPHHQTYLHYKGKPLIVCYAIRDWFKAYTQMKGPYRDKFSLVWSSGEDSNADKWGWQLEPWVGAVPSPDSTFVTSSVRWNPADGVMWRKSLAWMDYNFALARTTRPEYIIVGSYDDPTERNAWMISDTSNTDASRQMRDKFGDLSERAYYDRVREWTAGGNLTGIPGGVLPDGAYRISSADSGRSLCVRAEGKQVGDLANAAPGATLALTEAVSGLDGVFWFYHLGSNRYRIVALSHGLSLEAPRGSSSPGAPARQAWDSTDIRQRWIVKKESGNTFSICSPGTGMVLCGSKEGSAAHQQPPERAEDSRWRIRPVLTL